VWKNNFIYKVDTIFLIFFFIWLGRWGLVGLQKTGSLQVGEHLDDVLGHGGRSGQMVTGGLESVFIGNPVDSQDDAIGSGERVGSLGDGADILGFRSDLLLAAALGNFGAIGGFETVETIQTI
jgi:hypothetical protein